MTFKLNIECSKDIETLHIDFADGTSAIHTKSQDNTVQTGTTKQRPDQVLNTDEEYAQVSQDIVKLPEIADKERPVNVAEELQNFNL